MHTFEHVTPLPCSAERAFEFLIRPKNLETISPPHVGLTFLEAPEVFELGSRMIFKVFAYGMVQTITHDVIEFEPFRFREQAIESPLKVFFQEYRVVPDGDKSVLISKIDFEQPPGFLGLLLTPDKVRTSLEDGFDARADLLEKALR